MDRVSGEDWVGVWSGKGVFVADGCMLCSCIQKFSEKHLFMIRLTGHVFLIVMNKQNDVTFFAQILFGKCSMMTNVKVLGKLFFLETLSCFFCYCRHLE